MTMISSKGCKISILVGCLFAVTLSHAKVASVTKIERRMIFVPGYMGLSEYVSGSLESRLSARGVPVHVLRAPDNDTVRDQAKHLYYYLQSEVNKNPRIEFDIVAHSRVGLASRLMAARFPLKGSKVNPIKSITSLATPHEGTPLAYYMGGNALEFSPEGVEAFNSPAFSETYSPLVESIRYLCVSAYMTDPTQALVPAEAAGFNLLLSQFGLLSDGVVPLDSQCPDLKSGSFGFMRI